MTAVIYIERIYPDPLGRWFALIHEEIIVCQHIIVGTMLGVLLISIEEVVMFVFPD